MCDILRLFAVLFLVSGPSHHKHPAFGPGAIYILFFMRFAGPDVGLKDLCIGLLLLPFLAVLDHLPQL
jgi:hypothetical protein